MQKTDKRLDQRFQVRDCPDCGRTTVVDSRHDDQRCDWVDTCGELFDISDAELSDDAHMDGTELVRH